MNAYSRRFAAAVSTITAALAIGAAGQAAAHPSTSSPNPLQGIISATQGLRATAATPSQLNAIGSARSYLDTSSFSRKGLIAQLEYEKFSYDDAVYAVDHITVNWNEQAAKSAKTYLQTSSFSRSGLIDQLEYEGFTATQAEYGVAAAGL